MDWGKFLDDPDKYIDVFQELTQTFHLSWKDAMFLLSQTLSRSEKPSVTEAAQQFGDEYLANAGGASPDQIDHYPAGQQAVPWEDLNSLMMS